ncbi:MULTISPECIES: hypothetical protein [Acinetobacter]|uniref:Uncharacterized protein n=1 Tax=Acinetobacter variabilis TaxID=70346 RepID=N9NX46_9GAMM|nr:MULTISPECIES: hypothetical protein [Acinetobacter]AUX90312.1 hypothetical protein C3F22_11090 [Acinetobacter sp. ACNIH1]ENX10131.1 hypothetical protein F897_01248 [Acinetobacter variabilis]UBI30336.1 hypothetical protein LA331_13995 [Acinetobacter variabilis]
MNLFYLLLNLDEFPANHLIYAELPWTLESKAISIDKNSKPELNLNINNIEYSYFLEIAMARKLLQVYSTNNVCLADTCQRVIEYVLREQN